MRAASISLTLRGTSSRFTLPVAWSLVALIMLWSVVPGAQGEPGQAQDREMPPSVIFTRVAPSTLIVPCTRKDGQIQGSSVVIDADQVVTNYHVVEGAQTIQVRHGSQSWPATLLAFDQRHDLAILSVPQLGRPKVSLRPASDVKVGEHVFAVGAPRGLELSLSDGLVSALRTPNGELAQQNPSPDKGSAMRVVSAMRARKGEPAEQTSTLDKGAAEQHSSVPPSPLIQTTAPVSPGSSGGGLFDNQGRLIGIITFGTSGQNLNFAHPSEWVTELRAPRPA